MKTNSRNSIKLGLFVSVSVLLFILAIYFVGVRQQLFSKTFHIGGVFRDINGLQIGCNVRFSGINVGVVEDIVQVTDSTVLVDMRIQEETRKFIKKNARAIINSDGLVGNKIVSISPGKPGAACVADDDMIETVQQVSMDDILTDIKTTTANAVLITDDLAFILMQVADGNGVIGKLFFDSAFAEVMDDAVVNLKQGAGGFKQNMDAAGQSFLLKGYLKKKEREREKAQEHEDAQEAEEAKEKARAAKQADAKAARKQGK